ncbi:MAG: hypothetical protein ABJE94_15330 [Parasphingorhabdus sp.]|uniref:hypothetical protein n=1 Tax=Parasphingorhabdus sp. TaxID=2709688 RepID=UPI0032670127
MRNRGKNGPNQFRWIHEVLFPVQPVTASQFDEVETGSIGTNIKGLQDGLQHIRQGAPESGAISQIRKAPGDHRLTDLRSKTWFGKLRRRCTAKSDKSVYGEPPARIAKFYLF